LLLNPCKIWGPDGVEESHSGVVGYGTILKFDRWVQKLLAPFPHADRGSVCPRNISTSLPDCKVQ
jgi:hypothetical protein